MKRRRPPSPRSSDPSPVRQHRRTSFHIPHQHQQQHASVGEILGLSLVLLWLLVGGCRGCLQCKLKPPAQKDPKQGGSGDSRGVAGSGGAGGGGGATSRSWQPEETLQYIAEVSSLQHCPGPVLPSLSLKLPLAHLESVRRSAELAAALLGTLRTADQKLLEIFLERSVKSTPDVIGGRLLWIGTGNRSSPQLALQAELPGGEGEPVIREGTALQHGGEAPWLNETSHKRHGGHLGSAEDSSWSNPYFVCETRRWMISYTAFAYPDKTRRTLDRLGLVSLSVDATEMDINQCDDMTPGQEEKEVIYYSEGARPQLQVFRGTHKCHNLTSECQFTVGEGWTRGSYVCRCRVGFYSPAGLSVFNGTLVESAWTDRQTVGSPTYDKLYACKACQPGCDTCNDDSPCLAHYNWAFRISLLVVSLLCIVLTVVLSLYVYRYRKLKVIKVASPIFLCITLLGCAIMYSEMAAIFPVLDVYSCVATKWTRHMGFCITYSALLLKTWRVSLTYRVKSAHKLKLTDKQLLHWLFPILLVMAIYLGTWTISATPEAVYILDWQKLKFKQCDFNWWDHSLAIGEFLFLLWGIRVCYSVRNAESFFNEAKHISWAVYSITIVNIFMVMIHLVILPNASPDVKYLFGFIRTQMSTTATTILIFGPKFYRVVKGQGDTWDNRARARGVTASFSLNGVGLMHEETPDLYQENEELKEEIQKLAAQIEFMKIVHMELNNRHLKPKHNSFFSLQPGSAQSPIVKSIYMKFESTDSPGSRISPAAELVSERV